MLATTVGVRHHRPRGRDGRAAARRRRLEAASSRARSRARETSRSRCSRCRSSTARAPYGVVVVSKLGLDQFDARRPAPARGARRPRGGRARQRVACTRPSGARPRSPRRCSGSAGSSPRRKASTVISLIAAGSARLLAAARLRLAAARARRASSRAARRWGEDGAPLEPSSAPLPPAAAAFIAGARDAVRGRAGGVRGVRRRPAEHVRPATSPSRRSSIDGRWGAIAVATRDGERVGERELELLDGVAHQAKLAITNASRFASLERTFLSTVEALANALEANDEYTSSHARWITDLALRVGRELGLDPQALKRVELGALFHDIGKIGIPVDDPRQAGAAHRRGAALDRDASGARRADPRADRAARGRLRRSSAPATSAGTARATPTG